MIIYIYIFDKGFNFFFLMIDKEKLYIKKRWDTKNSALKVYRKYTKEAKRLKPEGDG